MSSPISDEDVEIPSGNYDNHFIEQLNSALAIVSQDNNAIYSDEDIETANSVQLSRLPNHRSSDNDEYKNRCNHSGNNSGHGTPVLQSPSLAHRSINIRSNTLPRNKFTNKLSLTMCDSPSQRNKIRNVERGSFFNNNNEDFDGYNSNSNETLDIIITYLNGQKNLYIHSSKYVKSKLNMIMIPIFILLSVGTIIVPLIKTYRWSFAIISITNGLITFLLVLINYLKLETLYSSLILTANQYDKLHASLNLTDIKYTINNFAIEQSEFTAYKLMEFEHKISEIQNTIDIPNRIKSIFPVISHINIFSFIKRIETDKANLMIKYREIDNEIRLIKQNGGEGERKKTRYGFLIGSRDKLKNDIIRHNDMYNEIDSIFIKEIKNAETYRWWSLFCKTKSISYDTNTIVYKHLAL